MTDGKSSWLVERLACPSPGRPPGELDRSGEIGLPCRGQHRQQPGLVLQERLDFESLADPQHGRNVPVPLGASAGNEIIGDLAVADPYLNAALGTEMVGTPCLITLALAANPISHQKPIVEVQVVIDDLPV